MSPRQAAWLLATALLILLVTFTAPAFSQQADDSAETGAETGMTASQEAAVEQILRQQEQLLRGQRFSYAPGNRRDPFRSLIEKVDPSAEERPPGLLGMYIDEIDLNGIVKDSSGGDVAYFTGSDNRGYFLRVGDQVYDGAIIAIDPDQGAVTFRQQVDDPRRIKPYRDVVRTLESLEDMTHD